MAEIINLDEVKAKKNFMEELENLISKSGMSEYQAEVLRKMVLSPDITITMETK